MERITRDDRDMAAAEQNREPRERREEEEIFELQRRKAEEDRAQRARERLEKLRQMGIQNARQAAGQCIFCGRPLHAIARFFGAVRHRCCESFTE